MGLWDRLADEWKARLIEVIGRTCPRTLPTLSDQRSAVSDRNRREGQKVQMNPLSRAGDRELVANRSYVPAQGQVNNPW